MTLYLSIGKTPVLAGLLACSFALTGVAFAAPVTSEQAVSAPLFRDSRAPVKVRVNDLISRLTLEEKVSQLVMDSTAIPRLGIPAYHWWSECIHGVANAGRATQFPAPIALASGWNPELMYRVASAAGDEMRAKHRAGADSPQYQGLTCWGPTINMARDPRWGRTEETYGEDPYLTGRMALAFITGLQGDDPRYLKIAATPKHMAAYNEENNRERRDVHVSERALREYYLPAFRESVVAGRAASVMMSYNGVNGVPNTINTQMMTDILRKEWGFDGVVVPDVSATSHLKNRHHKVRSYPEAAARFIKAGGSLIADGTEWRGHLGEAVKSGLLTEKELTRPLTEVLTLRLRLGQFDPPEMFPYSIIPPSLVGSPGHRLLALQAAREGIVLLQNRPVDNGKKGAAKLLPLDRTKLRSITVIGPYADMIQLGGYSGEPANSPVSPYAGIRGKAMPSVRVRLLPWSAQKKNGQAPDILTDEARKVLRESDVVIAVMGLDDHVEREGIDRKDLRLPPDQDAFLKSAYSLNRRIIVVLENGGPVSDIWMRDNVPAIVELWYPGEQGGDALADVIFGDYNPAGRLPLTVYQSEKQLPPMDDYEVSKGRTYRYLRDKPLYPFGHGESYTKFSYSGLELHAAKGKDGEVLEASVEVRNTGQREGDEVVQIYGAKLDPGKGQPQRQLLAFRRIRMQQGEAKRLEFSVPSRSMAYWDEAHRRFAIEGGAYEILAGASSADIKLRQRIELNGTLINAEKAD